MNWKALLVAVMLIPPWMLFAVCAYWYFIDIDPPSVHTSVKAFDINGMALTAVRAGGTVIIARDSCVTDEGKAFYSRWLLSCDRKLGYAMPSGEVRLVKGCLKRFNEIRIPNTVEPGMYDYVVTLVFVNNPLVETRMSLPVLSFEVLP